MNDARQLPMPLTYARLILQQLGTTPRLRSRLLQGTGISEAALLDPAAEARLSDLLTMFENAHQVCEPGWTLRLHFDLAAQGPLGFAMACAPTLADSLDVMARYGHVRAPWFRLQPYHEADEWGVWIRRQFPVASQLDVAMVESVLLSAQNLVESVRGRVMAEGKMYFDYPPPSWSRDYDEAFHGSVNFNSEFAGVGMPERWRRLPCPLADPGMYQAALSRLELERRRLDSADFLEVRIAMVLAAAGDSGLDLETTARRLNLSRRTLLRRLAEAGTSFGALLDAHRRERAQSLLLSGKYSVAEVGYRVGYQEPANFSRAFKKWCGVTPGKYRAGIAG